MKMSSTIKKNVCISIPELTAEEIKKERKRMGLSQFSFSVKYGIPINTLRAWEQGTRVPRPKYRALLQKLLCP